MAWLGIHGNGMLLHCHISPLCSCLCHACCLPTSRTACLLLLLLTCSPPCLFLLFSLSLTLLPTPSTSLLLLPLSTSLTLSACCCGVVADMGREGMPRLCHACFPTSLPPSSTSASHLPILFLPAYTACLLSASMPILYSLHASSCYALICFFPSPSLLLSLLTGFSSLSLPIQPSSLVMVWA